MHSLKYTIVVVIMYCIAATCSAMEDYTLINFSQITISDGLSNNNIACVFKDADDFMWFGTRNGLCRYNGHDIRAFHSTNSRGSISGDRILCINQDNEGFIWVGTFKNGLNKYCPDTETFTSYNLDNNVGDMINNITVTKDGTVWICSNNGLAYYNREADSFSSILHDPGNEHSLNSTIVYDLLENRSGNLYVATEHNDIQLFDRESMTFHSISYKRDPELNQNYRKRLLESPDGKIWIAAPLHGLSYYDPLTEKSENIVLEYDRLALNNLNGEMAISPDEKLWITTDGDGIIIMDLQTYTFRKLSSDNNESSSISSDHIYTVYFDDREILWVGTFGGGISYYNPNQYKFKSYFSSPGDLQNLQNKSVTSLFQDEQDGLWIGTDGYGLFHLSSEGVNSYEKAQQGSNALSSNSIVSLNADQYGNVLIGTYLGGLNSLNKQNGLISKFDHTSQREKQISSLNVWDILRDSKNRIWLGLLGTAADLYDPKDGTFKNFGPGSDLPEKIDFTNVMNIMEDVDGDIWFGTEGKGVYILDKETSKIIRIAADSSFFLFSSGIILSLMQDHWGYIWIGTEGNGLIRYNKKTGQTLQFTVEDGLPSNIITSILEDQEGNLWLGTANGLALYDSETKSFSGFVLKEGLNGLECNRNALIMLNDGRIALGTTSGINFFRPEKIEFNDHVPKVIFSDLKVAGKTVHPGDTIHKNVILSKSLFRAKEITLTHRENNFAIEFAALTYTLPGKCKYKYMLEDIDNDWTTVGSDLRTIQYSNLPHGQYILKVKASNSDGKWGDNEKHLKINILPPFYNTFWFKGIAASLLVLIIYLIYRSRLNLHKSNFIRIQLEQEHKIMELEKEKLESELKTLTFHVLNRNRFLINQKNRLTGLTFRAKESVRIGLQDIIDKLYDEINDDRDWKHIEPQLDKVYSNFISRLKEKHQDLTISEIKIASYVRMNLTTKEISELMHKTIRAVENDRYRLRKKLGLDTNDSLQKYLINL